VLVALKVVLSNITAAELILSAVSYRNHSLWVQTSEPGQGDPALPLAKKTTRISYRLRPIVTLHPAELTLQVPQRRPSNPPLPTGPLTIKAQDYF
jgi:hypothetical protein